ncbi:unnamed protein product [Closterium sp. NIES-54]
MHLFRCGHWNQLYSDYAGSLHQAKPPQHQNDPLGICSRVEGLAKIRDLTTSSLVLQLDIENAFNSVERKAFFNALTNTPLAPLIPFTRSFYATPSQLLTDPRLSTTALTSRSGVRQGDPLGPLLFAASTQQHLRRVAAEHPEVTVLAYADDITMIGPATATLGGLRVLTPLLAQDGLTCNLRKSSVWSSSPLQVDELPEGLPLTHEGVQVLGSPVGSQHFSDLVRSTLTDAAAPLGSLASIHPQHTLLLLSRCISHRIGYLLRTTPADVLPLSEWHAWCAELLNTALTAASIQPPRREAEFNFLIRQATLPVALGGLGLTDPTTEAALAYLASTTEVLRLLRSLDLPATAALGSNSNRGAREQQHRPGLPHGHSTECTYRAPTERAHTTQLAFAVAKMAREAQLVVYLENAMYSPPDDPKKADVIVHDPDSGKTWIIDTTITDPVLQNRDPAARKPPGWAAREAQKRKERDYFRHTEHHVFCALAVETYGANAPPTTAFLKLLATAAARNRFRANPLAKSTKKMACHFSQRWSVALQRSQANALHTKARAGIEAAHPQMAADPWPLHLGDILHTLEG